MKIVYLGGMNRNGAIRSQVEFYGYKFPKGVEVSVTSDLAITKLGRSKYFKLIEDAPAPKKRGRPKKAD